MSLIPATAPTSLASDAPGVPAPVSSIETILTYHVEGDLETPSAEVFEEVAAQVRLADRLGYRAVWFAEHHFHAHRGHLPNPLLFALHLAGKTEQIHLGSAVITTALHHPLRLAEDLLTADLLTGGRLSIGIGSGSSPSEFEAFGISAEQREAEPRHKRFAEGLDVLEQAWAGGAIAVHGEFVTQDAPPVLPRAIRPLSELLWIASNSASQAYVAGQRGYGIMLSRERGLGEMQNIVARYAAGRASVGLPPGGRIAASRPVYVGTSEATARDEAAEAIARMVDRQRRERPAFANLPPPVDFDEACRRVQFVVGGVEGVAEVVRELRAEIPFTAIHIQPRWVGFSPTQVQASIQRFKEEVVPRAFG
jgi:alkanesulfonate monooxygenase SsuD/methylene tetrahydromethanopterin reductase-like flavin-dependent oxidoreductase (luciferase family)